MPATLEERTLSAHPVATERKRVLLVNPPSGFLIDDKVFLPLGIAGVASTAQQQGHHVDLLDLASVDDYAQRTVDAVTGGHYDAVGITATSPQFFYAYRILKALKQQTPKTKVIIGGSHASMFSALRRTLITRFLFEGQAKPEEGQERLEKLLHDEDPNFERLEEFDAIAEGEEHSLSAALHSQEKWVNGGIANNLDALPLPARQLFDVASYLRDPQGSPKFVIGGKPSGSLISQRGCPYMCEFCCGRDSQQYHQVKLPGGILRAHSPQRILEELDSMNEQFGISAFMFYDDEFNLNVPRTLALCEALATRNYQFRGFVKSDLFVKNPEVVTAMKAAGFVEILTGVESGSTRILSQHLHKKTSPELNYQAAMLCLEEGMAFKALTMLGHTSETPRDVMDTRDWLLKVGTAFRDKLGPGYFTFDLTVFQPYAGCPIWDRARKNNGPFSDEFGWAYHSTTRN